jgi:hypothetical protein
MRDIDFDELDQAVNRFLGNDKKSPSESEEIAIKVNVSKQEKPSESLENAPKEEIRTEAPREMVFPRRSGMNAGDFHSNTYPKRVDFTPSLAQENEPSQEISKEKVSSEIKDNFDEKLHREHKNKGVDILDNLSEIKFEEPILDEEEILEISQSDEKILSELKSESEENISAEVFEKQILSEIKNQDSSESEIFEKNDEKAEIEASPILSSEELSPVPTPVREANPRIFVPERPGLHQIADEEEMVVFGTKNNEISAESTPKIETAEVEEVVSEPETPKEDETAEKIAVNFSSDKKEDLSEKTIEVPQISAEPKSVSKISIQTEVEKEKIEDSPEVVSQSVSPEKISADEIKTPFVQNAKIEKRPLGSPQSGKVSNFDIKPADRSREIRRAKFENSPSSAPMLSRDEYSAPVVAKKKKSGFWTVALIMLIMAVFGVGGGFAIWYFFGQ